MNLYFGITEWITASSGWTIMDEDAKAIVEKARENQAVEALYREVEAVTPVTVGYNPRQGPWSSQTADGKTEIIVSLSSRPEASLAHELLHARLKTRGYRQYGLIGTMDPNPELLKYINEALDNELQHHRIFPEFLEMGFTGDQFYHDGDEADFSQLQAEIETTKPDENPGALLLNFLTLISPGGADSENVRSEMRRVFEERCGPDSYAKMQAIEREFNDWRKSPGLDAGKTIAAILKHLGNFERTWIATGQDFPADGHFVSEPFTLQELTDHMSAKQGG